MGNPKGFKAGLGREDAERAAEWRRDGKPFTEIGELLGITGGAVVLLLKRHGIEAEFGAPQRRYSEGEKSEMVVRYTAGESAPAVAESMGGSCGTVLRAVRDSGRKVRDFFEANRRVEVDEAAFDVLTADACYWLGFLTADAHISTKRGCIALGLSSKDGHHVYAFRDFMKAGHKVTVRQRPQGFNPSTVITSCCIDSRRLVNRITELGIRQGNGSEVCAELAASPAYWLGLCDGDGCFGYKDVSRIELCGGQKLLEQFRAFVHSTNPDCGSTVMKVKKANIHRIVINSTAAANVQERMYASGVSVCLERKRVLALESIKLTRERDTRREAERIARPLRVCLTPGCGRGFWAKGYCDHCLGRMKRAKQHAENGTVPVAQRQPKAWYYAMKDRWYYYPKGKKVPRSLKVKGAGNQVAAEAALAAILN